MTDPDYLDDETIRHAFNRFCGKFQSGFIVGEDNIRNFSVGFADELRAAYRKGWHKGYRDAPYDD